ncbi:MAG: pepC [Bacteroidetes bacterium]|jgi:bleomycin hydrolase|nr:pepC [Bacteroidota bacterium]
MTKHFILAALACSFTYMSAQDKSNKKNSEYKFTVTKNIEATSVKNQGKTGTCWTFSSLSFFESELIRMGKGKDFDLSEMFVVRTAYPLKAENYVRMHGKAQFAEGGEFHDVAYVLKNYGMVPTAVYNGSFQNGAKAPYDHKVMDSVLAGQLKQVVDPKNEVIQPAEWRGQFNSTLNTYLGEAPQNFEFKGKKYTPQSYAKELGLNADDYVYITSFTHHPFYQPFVIEIPDNWAWQQAYNIPLDEFMQTMSGAINKGFGIGWAADVSEKYFRFKEGLAIVPEDWASMKDADKDNAFTTPVKQAAINQEIRQAAFDNYETQDDHGMHIVGMAKDQNGAPYYIVKNSWGTDRNECDGYFYASEAYVKYKTISIMVHKKALDPVLAKKLGITQ